MGTVSLKREFKSFNSQQEIELKRAFAAAQDDLTELRTELAAAVADLTALRTTVANLVTDMANRITNHNTLRAKLNLDAGVTDVDYAAATAQVSAAPDALTATTPAALTLTD